MSRYILNTLFIVLAFLAPFFFPWPAALALGILASLFFPPAVILTGALIDILYFNGIAGIFRHGSFPYFTIIGIVIAFVAYFVQQFVKTRIMS